jgi:PII-like signaling protein
MNKNKNYQKSIPVKNGMMNDELNLAILSKLTIKQATVFRGIKGKLGKKEI